MYDQYLPQVDENMARAQKRDAARSGKFYFRKDVYAIGRSGAGSTASSSGYSSPTSEVPVKKDKKMRNCFPPLPLPENGAQNGRPVEEEYEEMTMNEIINGKVCLLCLFEVVFSSDCTGRFISGSFGSCIRIPGNVGR